MVFRSPFDEATANPREPHRMYPVYWREYDYRVGMDSKEIGRKKAKMRVFHSEPAKDEFSWRQSQDKHFIDFISKDTYNRMVKKMPTNPATDNLKPYKSLGWQAEDIGTYDAYKEKIDRIREMNYPYLYDLFRDAETALQVLVRGEAKGDSPGIEITIQEIMKLGREYLIKRKAVIPTEKSSTEYTYEFMERQGRV